MILMACENKLFALLVCSTCQREKVCSFVALWWFFFCPFLNSKRVQGLGVVWGTPDLPFQPALVPFGGWSKQDCNCSCTMGQCHGALHYHPIHHDHHDSESGQHDCSYYCNNCYITSWVLNLILAFYISVSQMKIMIICEAQKSCMLTCRKQLYASSAQQWSQVCIKCTHSSHVFFFLSLKSSSHVKNVCLIPGQTGHGRCSCCCSGRRGVAHIPGKSCWMGISPASPSASWALVQICVL